MAEKPDWGRVQSMVDEFVRTSRKHAEDLVSAIRKEIQRQADVLGIATKDDVSRLERRVREAEKAGRKPAKDAAKKGPTKHKAGTKKPSGSS